MEISVIIPLYNEERYLNTIIDCLKFQTFKDFEVLLIDDGSIDKSSKICSEITKVDFRFKYIKQENSGVSSTRNNGLKTAQGKYITFLDADDHIPENYLKTLYEAISTEDADIAFCDVAIMEEAQEKKRFCHSEKELTPTRALNAILSRTTINSGPYAKLFKRELLNGLSFQPLKAYEDILFVIEAVARCKRITSTSETTYFYEQHSDSAMGKFLKTPQHDIIIATDSIMHFIKRYQVLDASCTYITLSHLMQVSRICNQNSSEESKLFLADSRALFRRYWKEILTCSAFPWKEKIVFLLYALNLAFI